MKPNDMNIDEILKRYLPRATPEEADAAGERVLKRIRALRFHERSECKPGRAQPSVDERSECKPGRAQPSVDERSECKPDAKRKRDSAQPQDRAQPSVHAGEEPKAVWLPTRLNVALLAAVDELQGRGRPVTITLKAEELLEEMVSFGWVPVILAILERMELVTSSPDPHEPDVLLKRTFQLTPSGRETLAAARADAARRAAGPLADFA